MQSPSQGEQIFLRASQRIRDNAGDDGVPGDKLSSPPNFARRPLLEGTKNYGRAGRMAAALVAALSVGCDNPGTPGPEPGTLCVNDDPPPDGGAAAILGL